MKKKVVGGILTAMMITGLFAGCGNNESQSGDGANTGSVLKLLYPFSP